MAAGCVSVTSKTRLQSMEEEIAALKEELRLTRQALVVEGARPGTGEQTPREALRMKIAELDIDLELAREQLGERHAKTVDLQKRRDRLMQELLTMEAGKKE